MKIEIRKGSLLDQKDCDIIVNAANCRMRGGSGIDGAIHRLAGPMLLEELKDKAPRGCPTSKIVETAGHDSGFKRIYHVPGPIWHGGFEGENDALQACYTNCLDLAHHDAYNGFKTIGFCSISTGIYGFPIIDASLLALEAIMNWIEGHPDTDLETVVIALYTDAEYDAYIEHERGKSRGKV
jgi:O-acetyl-ADP-ribose deacetylase (regulator of RNase III)